MSGPLSQVTFDQNAGYLPINLVAGDDLEISIAIPFNITMYTFAGTVSDSQDFEMFTFTITEDQLTPTGIILVSLDGTDTQEIPVGATYQINWTVDSKRRTFLNGPIVVSR